MKIKFKSQYEKYVSILNYFIAVGFKEKSQIELRKSINEWEQEHYPDLIPYQFPKKSYYLIYSDKEHMIKLVEWLKEQKNIPFRIGQTSSKIYGDYCIRVQTSHNFTFIKQNLSKIGIKVITARVWSRWKDYDWSK